MDEFDYQDYIILFDRLRCDDVIFRSDAFDNSIGQTVPLLSRYDYFDMTRPDTILGIAILEKDLIGITAKCKFYDTEIGNIGKDIFIDGDDFVLSCPIFQVKRDGKDVIFGRIPCVVATPKFSAFTYADNN